MKQIFTTILIVILTGLSTTICHTQLPLEKEAHKITTTAQLHDSEYLEKIENLYEQGFTGEFSGKNDVSIYYKHFRQPKDEKGAILISSGRTEAALKYKELIFDLYKLGYSVYIIDHRGQGLSGRMTEDREMGYVDNFQYYIDDMKMIFDSEIKNGNHQNVYLLAHSLGGTIGVSYLEQYPDDFDAAAFSSPMLGLDWYIGPLAALLSGKNPKYAPGQSGYSNDSTKFKNNDVTGSETRYYIKISENSKVPESRLGGASVQWLHQSCKHIKKVFKNIDKLETPVLIMSAENESVVNPKAYDKFVKKAEKHDKICILHQIQNAQHELLMEKDAQRTEAIESTLKFFEKYIKNDLATDDR